MIGARHTPVRPLPAARLTPEALKGREHGRQRGWRRAPARKAGGAEGIRAFRRHPAHPAAGGPPKPRAETAITLDKAELERIGDLWRDVQTLIGRRNLGVRLFNVSGMLSSLLASPGRQAGGRCTW